MAWRCRRASARARAWLEQVGLSEQLYKTILLMASR